MTESDEGTAEHLARISDLRSWARDNLAGKIIAFAGDKGGAGKTTMAIEVAYCLDAVLVDLDWHTGNSSRSLGWRHEDRMGSPALDALLAPRTPRPIKGGDNKPDLVPSAPDMESSQPPSDHVATCLTNWAKEWDRPVVVDTHPGGGDAANGATQAAHSVVAPVKLAEKDLEALNGWAATMDGYPLLIVPNFIPPVPPGPQLAKLTGICQLYKLTATTFMPRSVLFEQRRARTALCSAKRMSARAEPLIASAIQIAKEVGEHARATV